MTNEKPANARQIGMDTEQPDVETPNGQLHSTWYRGSSTEFLPDRDAFNSEDGIRRYVVKGWEPERPFIDRDTRITAFGSCFARHIGDWLAKRNYNISTAKKDDAANDIYVIRCGEGMVNSYAILSQFEWALENRVPSGEYWHGYDAEAFGYDDALRQKTRDIFLNTELFVLTFGLSEIWYDKVTNEVFWRAIPADKFDPERHAFRVATASENSSNLQRIYDLIRRYVPNAKILFTLSPIPLMATFQDRSCVTANSVSKASLRVAIDEVIARNAPEGFLYYWPSYEIVTETFKDKWKPDRRHLKKPILNYIMYLFASVWCTEPPPAEELRAQFVAAKVADATIPKSLMRAIDNERVAKVRARIGKMRNRDKGLKQLLRSYINTRNPGCLK